MIKQSCLASLLLKFSPTLWVLEQATMFYKIGYITWCLFGNWDGGVCLINQRNDDYRRTSLG